MGRVLVVLGGLRPYLLLRELARERPQLALLGRQRERDACADACLQLGHDLRSRVRLTSQSIAVYGSSEGTVKRPTAFRRMSSAWRPRPSARRSTHSTFS